MCGILAVIPKQAQSVDRERFSDCLSLLKHRGPDNAGVYINSSVALGHTRLAIIDRNSHADQPFTDPIFGNFLIFNGEIYNFGEIKSALTKKGIMFRTESDTEVLYAALSTMGSAIIPELNGMFSFIFWNHKNRSIIISRDRFGIKPLFYFENEEVLIFASEIKAIISYLEKSNLNAITINKPSINEYLVFQNLISDQTFFEKINKFKAGTFREISLKNDKLVSSQEIFWNWRQDLHSTEYLVDYEIHLENHIEKAVQKQLVGEIDLGTFLSAGLDSSLITFYASRNVEKIKSFSVGFGFPDSFEIENFSDEIQEAKEIADFLRIKNFRTIVTEKDLYSSLFEIARVLEEPRMGQSYPNYFASRLASKHALVVLSGAGGDELFGGYPWRYEISETCDSWDSLILQHFDSSHKLLAANEIQRLLKTNVDYGDIERPRILHRDIFAGFSQFAYSHSDAIKAIISYDAEIFLEGLLSIEDKIGMSFSIETRFPFLDNKLVDFVKKYGKIETNFLGTAKRNNDGKRDLRRIAQQKLPKKVAGRSKQGFTGPDALWFRSENARIVFSRILGKDRAIWDYLDYNQSMFYLEQHQSGRRNLRHLVWSLLSLSEFFEITEK